MELMDSIIAAIATIISAIIGYFAYKERNKGRVEKRDLLYHPIHSRMKDFKEYIKLEITAEKRGKEQIVKNFLINMIEIYQEEFICLSKKVNNNNITNDELKEINLEALHRAINKRSTYFLNESYNKEERQALGILVNKHQEMMSHRIKHFRNDIVKTIESKYYGDQITSQALIFDKYIGEFSHIMTYFEDTIDEINGDFGDLNFKGYDLY